MHTVAINRKPAQGQKATLDKPLHTPILSLILRGGVILSATIIAFGVVLFLLTGQSGYATVSGTGASEVSQYLAFHEAGKGQIYFPTNPLEVWQGVISLKPFALIMLGLMLLIATPVLNVIVAATGFVKARNLAFTLISLFVLAVLILSFFLGKAGG